MNYFNEFSFLKPHEIELLGNHSVRTSKESKKVLDVLVLENSQCKWSLYMKLGIILTSDIVQI